MNELTFKSHTLTPIIINNQPYLGVGQIDLALQYSKNTTCRKIFERHADEFTPDMSFLTTIDALGGRQQVRVFSLRGCHLLAMFSKTPVAKEFRRWVLDLIESHNKTVVAPAPVDMCAMGGLVKRCCSAAIREELISLFNDIRKQQQEKKSRMEEIKEILSMCKSTLPPEKALKQYTTPVLLEEIGRRTQKLA